MIKVDETDPIGEVDLAFPYRPVSVKRGEDIKKYYDLSEEIGRGKFGTVYKCKEKSTGLCLAAKSIAVPNRKERKNVEREIDMMNRLQHPKIIQLYDAFEYNKMVCVVLELVEGGELFDRVLDEKFVLTEKACSIFIRQICDALQFIHERNIIHLDLKPENILCLTESGNRIKIIDFGLAREYDPNEKLQVLFGTPEFVAPEVVNFEEITFATDMWSVGVIAYVLVSGLSPFAGECDVETMGNVTVGKYDFNDEAFDNVSADCMDLITKLLMKNATERMTARDALRHRWVKKKPQYHPTNSNTAGSPLSFKAVYSDKDNSLTATKDNLRNCVDRWNDSSPYVFDKHTKSITSVHSSISSSIDDEKSKDENKFPSSCILESSSLLSNGNLHDNGDIKESSKIVIADSCDDFNNTNEISTSSSSSSSQFQLTNQSFSSAYKNPHNPNPIISLRDYFYALDRPKSIDNSFLSPSPLSSVEEFCLYDEIKKITHHLFKMTVPDPEQHQHQHHHEKQQQNQQPSQTEIQSVNINIIDRQVHDTNSMQNPIKEQTKVSNDTCSTSVMSEMRGDDDNTSTSTSNGIVISTKNFDTRITMDVNNNKINDAPRPTIEKKSEKISSSSSSRSHPFAEIFDKLTSTSTSTPTSVSNLKLIQDGNVFTSSIVHWPVSTKRTKFRVNQMSSRDVPIVRDCKPARLQKQNAIDAADTSMFDEQINKQSHGISTRLNSVEYLKHERFENKMYPHPHSNLHHRNFMQNSSSIDCGQLSVDERSINTFRSLFELHADTGRSVKKMQELIESQKK